MGVECETCACEGGRSVECEVCTCEGGRGVECEVCACEGGRGDANMNTTKDIHAFLLTL